MRRGKQEGRMERKRSWGRKQGDEGKNWKSKRYEKMWEAKQEKIKVKGSEGKTVKR